VLKGFIAGILATLAILLVVGYVGVTQGLLIPANADAKPSRMERWMASRSLGATIAREMPTSKPASNFTLRIALLATVYRANVPRRLQSDSTSTHRNSRDTASKTIPKAKRSGKSSTAFV
jgi:hypothetical protein